MPGAELGIVLTQGAPGHMFVQTAGENGECPHASIHNCLAGLTAEFGRHDMADIRPMLRLLLNPRGIPIRPCHD